MNRTPRTGWCFGTVLGAIAVVSVLAPNAHGQTSPDVLDALNAARAAARCAAASAETGSATSPIPGSGVPSDAAQTPLAPAPNAQSAAAAPALTALRADAQLDAAAAGLARSAGSVGRPLTELLAAQGYRAVRSMVIQVSGPGTGSALARFVEQRWCTQLASADWQDVGIHQRVSPTAAGTQVQTWLLLATRFAPPPPDAAAAIGERVLELVNQARAQARVCGTQPFAAAAPLKWNPVLARASQLHAQDMATHSYFSHDGRDGSQPATRATRAGYVWRATGENIAGGQTTAEAAVQGWIDSPPHCANLMGVQFSEMGVAYAVNLHSKLGIYWTQMFGTPR